MTAADRCLVVGASGAIGAAIATRLAADDWSTLWLHAHRHPERLPDCGLHVEGDLSTRDGVRAMFEGHAIEPSHLVVASGLACYGQIQDLDAATWQQLGDVNLGSAIWLVQAALPAMLAQRRGSIVLISSAWGRVGASCEAAYAATKAGLAGLARSLAQELGPSGIRINVVAPGYIESEMNAGFSAEEREDFLQRVPLGRVGQPDEVAAVVDWLLSDRARYITGAILGVDGGLVV